MEEKISRWKDWYWNKGGRDKVQRSRKSNQHEKYLRKGKRRKLKANKDMKTWLGTKSIEFIWHGSWADPELRFEGKTIDYWSIEEFVCGEMKDEGLDYNDDDLFGKYVREHEELIAVTIIEYADARAED